MVETSPITLVHVVLGTLAVAAGAAALLVRKGARAHRAAGAVFVATMIVSAGAGAYLGLLARDRLLITFFAGVLSVYLVYTSWRSAAVERVAASAAVTSALSAGALAASLFWLGAAALRNAGGVAYGFPAEDYFFLGGIAALAMALDASIAVRGGLKGRQRIARHLWRMCFAFFIAAGSLFTGPGAGVFPEAIRNSGVLSAPEAIIALTMIAWLAVALSTKRFDGQSPTDQ